MKKLLNTTDRVRLVLALSGDVINKLLGGDGSMDWFYRPWDVLNVTNSSYKTTIRRLLGAGEIIKTFNSNGEVVYRMSPKGETKYYRDYPLAKLKSQGWDGIWRMVIYDLPCKWNYKRHKLRDKLVELGFGGYQRSVYVTPLDVLGELKDYINDNGLEDSVVVFEGNRIFGENIKNLSEKLWGLEDINFGYLELERKIKQCEAEGKIKMKYSEIWEDFTALVLKDPFLPDIFLPDIWAGERVKKMVLSQRH